MLPHASSRGPETSPVHTKQNTCSWNNYALPPVASSACSWKRQELYTARTQRPRHDQHLQLVVRLVVVVLVLVVAATAAALVVLLDDRGADALDLLLLLLRLLRVSLRVGREPVLTVLDRVIDRLLLVLVHLVAHTRVVAGALDRGLHRVEVVVERVASVDALLHELVLLRELLRLTDHLLDLLLRQPALVVRDRDRLRLAGAPH